MRRREFIGIVAACVARPVARHFANSIARACSVSRIYRGISITRRGFAESAKSSYDNTA